jgi:hypothetical protein
MMDAICFTVMSVELYLHDITTPIFFFLLSQTVVQSALSAGYLGPLFCQQLFLMTMAHSIIIIFTLFYVMHYNYSYECLASDKTNNLLQKLSRSNGNNACGYY